MKRIAILLVGTLCLGAAEGISEGQQIAVGGGPGGAASACFNCHGMNGEGDAASGFPRLAGLDARYLYKQLQDYVSGTRESDIMAPIASGLSEQDRQNVAKYYASLPPAAAPGSEEPDPQLVQQGALLWTRGSAEMNVPACVACHGPNASGLGSPYPALAGQPATYIADELRRWREGRRSNDMSGVMAEVARRLDDRSIEAVAAYVSGLEP